MASASGPTVRWGILGAAGINASFLPGLREASGSQAVALASRSLDRARDEAHRWQIDTAYGSYEELLADGGIDAVYIPLPNHLHARWVVRALEAGKHVLCEKPLAIDREGMSAIRSAAESSGRLVAEAFMYRFAPRWRRALELIRDGAIGEPRIARIGFAFKQYPSEYNIRFDPTVGGGIEWDMGCYLTAMARDVLGDDPVAVTAAGHRRPSAEVTTSIEAILAFTNGRAAITHASFDYPNPYSQVEVIGDEGWIALPGTGIRREPFTRLLVHRSGQEEVFEGGQDPETTDFSLDDPYRLEIEHFATCVVDGQQPEFGLDDAQANLEAVLAMIASAEQGATVPITHRASGATH